ncbi:TIGR03643 family protein [Flavobacterium pedocola]
MKKSKISEMDNETLDRVVTMAQEEKKPFEVLKEEFGISENDVTELMRKRLSKDNFELWKKKVSASKPKPKPQKTTDIEDDDLDSKYYFKNKFD